jgi:hypothetical protein
MSLLDGGHQHVPLGHRQAHLIALFADGYGIVADYHLRAGIAVRTQ